MARRLSSLWIALALAGCGADRAAPEDAGAPDGGADAAADAGSSEDAGAPDGGADAGHGHGGLDAGERVDASTSDGGLDAGERADAGAAIEPCRSPGDYVEGRRYVTAADSYEYDPPCVRVRVGETVTIEASDHHPLARRPGGAATSPFPEVPAQAGDTRSYVFSEPGLYPFRCVPHEALGMIGVVEVVPR